MSTGLRLRTNTLLNLVIALLAATAICMAVIRLRDSLAEGDPVLAPRTVENWRSYSEVIGKGANSQASVVMVVFTDFQCGYCRETALVLPKLRSTFGAALDVVIRHAPSVNHPYSLLAAQAVECAGRQGRFDAYHDNLFADQSSIGKPGWQLTIMRHSGVPDSAEFSPCLQNPDMHMKVERDRTAAHRLGLQGTPAFLINDLLYLGFPGEKNLEESIRKALHRRDH